ncbi:MAG: transcriptional regulator [Nitrosopumilus sp.]|nr:transcriptional regulator [Nitrosopumilus sp.]
MSGFDTLLSNSLDETIRNNLGEKSVHAIEKRLFEKYGISILQAILEFHKLDKVLREFFGEGAKGIEKKFLENSCKLKSKNKNEEGIIIKDERIIKTIIEALGDNDKSKILNAVSEDAKIISDILQETKLPQTSGYRKINSLINDGLLVEDGFIYTQDTRKVMKYCTLFDNMKINIIKNKMSILVQMKKPDFSGSTILQIVCKN